MMGNIFETKILGLHRITDLFAIRYPAGYPVGRIPDIRSNKEKAVVVIYHNFFQLKFITSNGQCAMKYQYASRCYCKLDLKSNSSKSDRK